MRIDEVCPICGAERISWLGSSHFRKVFMQEGSKRVCEIDNRTPEDVFLYRIPPPRTTWSVA